MEPTTKVILLAVVIALATPISYSQHPHADMPQQFGSVRFPTSCEARVQENFERGVALLHSFWYEEAQKKFYQVVHDDPKCAIAYWGVAMTQWRQLVGPADAEEMKVGRQALETARELKSSAREQAYISALYLFFRGSEKDDASARAAAYSHAMFQIYDKYPDDTEAGAFYALSLLASEPENDTALANRRKAGEVLEKVFASEPEHPGVAHYLIHAYDKPQLAKLGLPAAERYAKIAPASPHALHMPSHIFARLGMWQADIDSNLASVAATQKVLAMHMEGAAHQFHAMDFLLTAYLQIGREKYAQQLIDKVPSMPATEADMWGGYNWHVYAMAEYPAVYTLEVRDWTGAAQLEFIPKAPPFVTAFTYWARSIGAARSGKATLARSDALQIKSIHDGMIAAHDSYFEDNVLQEFEEASAWADYADGQIAKAMDGLRTVAEKQEAIADEPAGIPARELLADMLLEAKKPDQALVEYERDLKFNPNRFNGLYGAGLAAEQAGRLQQAREFYRQLTTSCADSKSPRPELAHAAAALKNQ